MRVGYGQSTFEIEEGLEDDVIASRLDRDEDRAFVDVGRRLTAKTRALAEGFYETYRFGDASRDADSYGARFGFEFSPTGGDPLTGELPVAGSFLNGRFLLGFRSVTPIEIERVDYSGLVGSVDVTFGFGEGQRLQALYSRDIQPSIFDDNWFFIENRVGANFTYQMTERFSVTPGFSIGQNRYPLPQETLEGERGDLRRPSDLPARVRRARHRTLDGGCCLRLSPSGVERARVHEGPSPARFHHELSALKSGLVS